VQQAVHGKGRAGAIAQQPLLGGAVVCFDSDTGIHREAAVPDRLCALTRKKMRCTMLCTAPSRCMKKRSRFGTESTHWHTGSREKTWSLSCAAVSTMSRVLHEGHTPRPLQEEATK
jgi:hypothetical protein